MARNTSTHPCPVWCTRPSGHPFDLRFADGRVERWHETSELGGGALEVIVCAPEASRDPLPDRGGSHVGATETDRLRLLVTLSMDVGAGAYMTAAEAREAAAVLSAAADRLDALAEGVAR